MYYYKYFKQFSQPNELPPSGSRLLACCFMEQCNSILSAIRCGLTDLINRTVMTVSALLILGGQLLAQTSIISVPVGDAIRVMQVEVVSPQGEGSITNWGRINLRLRILAELTGIEEGVLNVVTRRGWAVQNMLVPPSSEPDIATYFDLGIDDVRQIDSVELIVAISAEPVGSGNVLIADIDFSTFPIMIFQWNAKGVGPTIELDLGPPPQTVPIESVVPLGQETFARYQHVTNVQTAQNQCVPMSLANSLQFLENSGKLTVPNDHKLGLKGDKTLVGKLDDATNRPVVSRQSGTGVCFTPMVSGQLKFLKDNNLEKKLIYRHQGRGYCDGLPAGDFKVHDSVSKDDGSTPEWDWMCKRVREACGTQAVFTYRDSTGNITGGHAVRLTGCGKLKGKDWIRYSHDALQSDVDVKDKKGLESVVVYTDDLNNDGNLNFGALNRELEFVFAQCTNPAQ